MSLVSKFPNVPNTSNFGLFRAGYIYTLNCPDTGLVRYVGKTFSTSKRFYEHLSPSSRQKTRKSNWVRGLISQGKYPVIEIIDDCDDFNWQEKECNYIKMYKAMGANLTNHTNGGEDGSMYHKHTDEAKAKISSSSKGKKRPREIVEKHRAGLIYKYKNDPEFKERAKITSIKNISNLTKEQKDRAIKNRTFALRKRSKYKFCDLIKINSKIKEGFSIKYSTNFFGIKESVYKCLVKRFKFRIDYVYFLSNTSTYKKKSFSIINTMPIERKKEIYEMSVNARLSKVKQDDLATTLGITRGTLRKIVNNYISNNE